MAISRHFSNVLIETVSAIVLVVLLINATR